MKYALLIVLDQTFGFLSTVDDYEWTTVHREAVLFDTKEKAQTKLDAYMAEVLTSWPKDYPKTESTIMRATPWIEEVKDVIEVQARPDTW